MKRSKNYNNATTLDTNMKNATLLLLFLICTACMHPYYGYSEAEWNRLPDKEKQAIKAEYQPIIDGKRAKKHDDLIEERTQQIVNLGVRSQGQ